MSVVIKVTSLLISKWTFTCVYWLKRLKLFSKSINQGHAACSRAKPERDVTGETQNRRVICAFPPPFPLWSLHYTDVCACLCALSQLQSVHSHFDQLVCTRSISREKIIYIAIWRAVGGELLQMDIKRDGYWESCVFDMELALRALFQLALSELRSCSFVTGMLTVVWINTIFDHSFTQTSAPVQLHQRHWPLFSYVTKSCAPWCDGNHGFRFHCKLGD